jgi:hypothetical protein
MKTLKTKILLLAITLFASSLLFISCSKKDEPILTPTQAPEQNPLAGYLAATGFDQVTSNNINLINSEFGLSFKPLVNGKITAFVVKIPDVNATLRMTIWNKTSGTVLKTETINYATAGLEVTKEITPLDIFAGTEYFVTFNSGDWYNRRRTNGSNATYPITVGDISITGYSYANGLAQTLPDSPQLSYYGGDISFKFQK